MNASLEILTLLIFAAAPAAEHASSGRNITPKYNRLLFRAETSVTVKSLSNLENYKIIMMPGWLHAY
jgi:hypothetical protein